MSKPPRRPSSSRTTTPRPRKIAGRDSRPHADGAAGGESLTDEGVADEGATEELARDTAADPFREPWLPDPRLTVTLLGWLAVVLVLALVLLGIQVASAWLGSSDEDSAQEAPSGEIVVPDGRPVVANEQAWEDGVAQAAEAAQQIVSVNWEDYDAEVEAAAELMTEEFEDEYRGTADDVRDQVRKRETVVRATVAAQAVARANETELQALIFLNQYVTRKDEEEGTVNVFTPYKVLVTMVHTDNGWLVDDLETDSPPTAQDE